MLFYEVDFSNPSNEISNGYHINPNDTPVFFPIVDLTHAKGASPAQIRTDINTYLGTQSRTDYNPQYDPVSESAGESSSTLDTYQQKLRHSFLTDSPGLYIIEWSCEVAVSDAGKGCGIVIDVDDTTVEAESMESTSIIYAAGGWMTRAGFFEITLDETAHTIDMDWRSDTAGKTAYIRKAVIKASRKGI